jgi:hypothetical protein
MTERERNRMPMLFFAGLGVILVLLAGVLVLTRYGARQPAAEARLPMTAAEQTYAGHIRFENLQMSRAANFLNQEVTYVFGTVTNDGPRTVREIEATIEFRDLFGQVVLRDTRRVLGARAAALAGRERREFQFPFEHVPGDWNRQYPTIRVTGLLLE